MGADASALSALSAASAHHEATPEIPLQREWGR